MVKDILKGTKKRKAVSLMVSYVILIGIVLSVAAAFFVIIKDYIDPTPVENCEEGTTITLEDYLCDGKLDLLLRNNGRFSINGVYVSVGNDTKKFPIYILMPEVAGGYFPGRYVFESKLKPSASLYANYSNKVVGAGAEQGVPRAAGFEEIRKVRIQPFIIDKKTVVFCEAAVIEQDLENCLMR
ncbi:hypothetical protein GOV14_05560 [Candidatus Pacearchaeota archaeon]|nr:hypothetical protein [Candidatus Pacearchaeota archaeon]